MKKYVAVILPLIMLSMKSDVSKKDLLCHHWVQFASTSEIGAPIKPTDASIAEDIIINSDGTYDESLYNRQMKMTGNWYLNNEETKMDLALSTLNGKDVSQFNVSGRHFNIIILKLTADTLIFGNEQYKGKAGGPLVYNHSDLYFVRKD